MDDPLSMWHPRLCDEWRFGGYLHEVMRNKELAKQTAAALGAVAIEKKKGGATHNALSQHERRLRRNRSTSRDSRWTGDTRCGGRRGAAQGDRGPRTARIESCLSTAGEKLTEVDSRDNPKGSGRQSYRPASLLLEHSQRAIVLPNAAGAFVTGMEDRAAGRLEEPPWGGRGSYPRVD